MLPRSSWNRLWKNPLDAEDAFYRRWCVRAVRRVVRPFAIPGCIPDVTDDHSSSRSTFAGAGFALLTLAGWSSVPLFLKHFTALTDPWTMNGWRYSFSAGVWFPFLLLAYWRGHLPPRFWKLALLPAAVNSFGQTCFAHAPYFIDPALLTFMLRLQIVFVALGAYLLFPTERVLIRSLRFWIGVSLAFFGSIGVGLLGREWPTGTTLWGMLLGVMAGMGFGAYSMSVRYFMHGINPILSFAMISLVTSSVLIPMMFLLGTDAGWGPLTFSWQDFILLMLSALVGIALAHVAYYAAIARLGVTVAAGLILLQPFMTGLGSFFWFHERLTVAQWMSGIAAVLGAGLMLMTQHALLRRARREASS